MKVVFTDAELQQLLQCALPRVEALGEMAAAMVQSCPAGDNSWAEALEQRDALASAVVKLQNALSLSSIPLSQP
jgi:hypothetical protein